MPIKEDGLLRDFCKAWHGGGRCMPSLCCETLLSAQSLCGNCSVKFVQATARNDQATARNDPNEGPASASDGTTAVMDQPSWESS